MSSRPAARGSEAARSIRLALRTSSMVAVSSASPSRCFLFWPGRRARIASLIVLATVAIPPTTQPHPLPIRPHAPRRRLGCAAQETMGGEAPYRAVLDERRPGAPLAAHLDQPCPPDPAVEPSYHAVDLWVNVSNSEVYREGGLGLSVGGLCAAAQQ